MPRTNSRIKNDGIEIAVGKAIARLRKERGLGQEAFAYKANINRTYITDIELGRRSVGIGILINITTALGLTVHQFMDAVNEERVKLNHSSV